MGESPELRNYFVAAGLNSIGILTGGGMGLLLARWIKERHAPDDIDVTGINVNRFHRHQSNPAFRKNRVSESLGNTYKVHYPDHQLQTCRNIKRSPLHNRLVAQGAYFRDVSGWESPAWYAGKGVTPVVEQESFGRESWFPHWAAEHRNCREDVALFDMSFMSKFSVQGRDAGEFLNYLSTANVDDKEGCITYTQWLNERGYMEADLTVTKLSPSEFIVVATDTMHNHVLDHMRRHLHTNDHVTITDVTARYAQINLQGPKSRELLQEITSVDLGDFPFRKAADIDIGLARALCMRITYVGELGYELFVPAEQVHHVYDEINRVGPTYNLRHAGLRALGSLRLEKGFPDYGHDMDNTDTLLECGLGFTCDFGKVREFVGQSAVLEQKRRAKEEGGLRKRMVNVLLDDPEPLLHHGEVLWRDDKPVSYIRAGSYGHTLRGSVGLAMLQSPDKSITKSFLQEGDWQVEIGHQKYPCRVSLAPFYDPKSLRVKGLPTSPSMSSFTSQHPPHQTTKRTFSSSAVAHAQITGTIPRGGRGIEAGQFAESRRTFSQDDVDTFARITRDVNPLHQQALPSSSDDDDDELLAKDKPVVHGMLVATLFTHIFGTLIPGCWYRKQDLFFRRAVRVDDAVVGRIHVTRVRAKGAWTLVQCETQVTHGSEVCVQGQAEVALPSLK